MSTNTRVFVYGTLKRGLSNARYLAGQRFLGEARTQPIYRMVSLGSYPGLFRSTENGRSIVGEVWEVDAACLARLDVLEDLEGGEYTREPAELQAPFDEGVVEIYLFAHDVSMWPDAGEEWRGVHP